MHFAFSPHPNIQSWNHLPSGGWTGRRSDPGSAPQAQTPPLGPGTEEETKLNTSPVFSSFNHLHVIPDKALVVHKKFVILKEKEVRMDFSIFNSSFAQLLGDLEGDGGRGVASLHIPHELAQLLPGSNALDALE